MSHRTQVTLTDAQYERLRSESRRSGISLAELVRRAIDSGDRLSAEDRTEGLEETFGAWADRDYDGAAYVEALRPGLGHRLESLDDRR